MNLNEKEVQKFKELKELLEKVRNSKDEQLQATHLSVFDFLNDRYFVDSFSKFIIDHVESDNIIKLLNNNVCSFQQIVDKIKSITDGSDDNNSCLRHLVGSYLLFKELAESNLPTKEDLRYLLDKINNDIEVKNLCETAPLIKRVLSEFVLDKETVDKFNNLIREIDWWYNEESTHDIFDFIDYATTHWYDEEEGWIEKDEIDQELLELNELNNRIYKFVCSFDEAKTQELAEVLKDNEVARNRLIQILGIGLEVDYDFESLIGYLKKPERRSILNI